MSNSLSMFCINDVIYHHTIDFNDDSTQLVVYDTDEVLYRVDSNAYVYDRVGRIGQFHMDSYGYWYFKGLHGVHIVHIATTNKDLLKAEVIVFTKLLENDYEKI